MMGSKERENFQRQSILVVDFITRGFKDLLDLEITRTYSSFEDFINQNQHELYHLCYYKNNCCQCQLGYKLPHSRVIYPVQLDKLLDQNGPKHPRHRSGPCCSLAKSGLSIDALDVTLARCLLIHFCSHLLSGSIRANIEILIDVRNNVYGHATEAKISDSEFAGNWSKTETALIEISKLCGNEDETRQKLGDLKKRTLDEILLIQYQNKILEEIQRENNLKEHVAVLTTKVEEFGTTLDEIKSKVKTVNEEQRRKCEEISEAMVDLLVKTDTFVSTSGLTEALTSLEERGTVLLVGPPGSGKTATGLELLRQYQGKQYTCLYLKDVTEFPSIVSLGEKCIVFCDDIFGKTNCKYNEETYSTLLEILYSYIQKGNVKVIMTIRESIMRICRQVFECDKLFYGSRVVNLGSDFKMSVKEKEKCLIKHCNVNNIEIIDEIPTDNCQKTRYILTNTIHQITSLDSSPLLGFPQACTLFTSNPIFTQQGLPFFKNANAVLIRSITDMRKEGHNDKSKRVDYTLLVYVLVNSNNLDLSGYDIEKIRDVCALVFSDHSNVFTSYDIEDSLDRLKGVYLHNIGTKEQTFQHRSIFEAVLLSCKAFNKEALIKFMDLDFIVEMIRPEGYVGTEAEVFITVYRKEYFILADHIITLLIHCDSPYYFVEKLMTSSLITQFAVELVKIMTNIYNEKQNIHFCFKPLHSVVIATHSVEWFTLKSFEFVPACLLFCNDNDALISFLSSVFPINSQSIVDCFLISCVQLKKCKAQTFWNLIKQQNFRANVQQIFFSTNVGNVLQQPYLKLLFDIVDDWKMLGSDIMNGMLENALTMCGKEIAVYLLENWDNTLIDANKAILSVCSLGLSEKVKLLLQIFDHTLFDEQTVFNMACQSGSLELVEFFLQEFDHSLFDVKTAFNMACKSGDSKSVKLLLRTFDNSWFDIKTAFNMTCNSSDSNSVKLLIETFDHILVDLKTAFSRSCEYCNSDCIELLIKTFDIYFVDAKTAFNMNNIYMNLDSIQLSLETFDRLLFGFKTALNVARKYGDLNSLKLVIQTFDRTLFNVKTAFNKVCKSNESKSVQMLLKAFDQVVIDVKAAIDMASRSWNSESAELLIQTFDHSLFDVKTVFNMACKSGNLGLVEFLLRKFDHGLFDAKTSFTMACRNNSSRLVDLLLTAFDSNMFNVNAGMVLACRYGADVFEMLLDRLDHKLINIKTVIGSACKTGNIKSVQLLLPHLKRNSSNITSVITAACRTGNTRLVNVLLEKLDDQNMIDIQSVLVTAVKSQSRKTIMLLLQKFDHKHIDINVVLYEAFKACSVKTILSILKTFDHQSINANHANHAIRLACEYGYPRIVEWLIGNFDDNAFNVSTLINATYISPNITKVGKIKRGLTTVRLEAVKLLVGHFDHKLFDMKSTMKDACQRKDIQLVNHLLQYVDNTLFNTADIFTEACEADNTTLLSFMLQNVDHQLLNVTTLYKNC